MSIYFGLFDNKGVIFPSILGSNFGLDGDLWLSINFATPRWSFAVLFYPTLLPGENKLVFIEISKF